MNGQNLKANSSTVLTTVNAPYSEKMDGNALAFCLKDPAQAKKKPGHVSSFFGEVPLKSQLAFASQYGISEKELAKCAHDFAAYSGESYPLAG